MLVSHFLAASRITLRNSLLRTMSPPADEVQDGQQVFPDEKNIVDINENRKTSTSVLKLDKHGLPLVPQPSDHKDDPLVSIL